MTAHYDQLRVSLEARSGHRLTILRHYIITELIGQNLQDSQPKASRIRRGVAMSSMSKVAQPRLGKKARNAQRLAAAEAAQDSSTAANQPKAISCYVSRNIFSIFAFRRVSHLHPVASKHNAAPDVIASLCGPRP